MSDRSVIRAVAREKKLRPLFNQYIKYSLALHDLPDEPSPEEEALKGLAVTEMFERANANLANAISKEYRPGDVGAVISQVASDLLDQMGEPFFRNLP